MVCILPYFAWGGKREHVLVLECDKTPFRRATYINQARVHQGYHYPRSISTAMKSCAKIERYQDAYVNLHGGWKTRSVRVYTERIVCAYKPDFRDAAL